MSTENNVKNIREVAGRVNLLLLIDHGGRAGSNFFQCLFDQHQSLIFCPLVHYVYSYWDDQFGMKDQVDGQDAIKFISDHSYFRLLYQEPKGEIGKLITKIGGDVNAEFNRPKFRNLIKRLFTKGALYTRREVITFSLLAYAECRGVELGKIKYVGVNEAISLRGEDLFNGFSGRHLKQAHADFPQVTFLALLRDPRAQFASTRHQMINEMGNNYGLKFGNWWSSWQKLMLNEISLDNGPAHFCLLYQIAAFKALINEWRCSDAKWLFIKNEDINTKFLPTITALCNELSISPEHSWARDGDDFKVTMLGAPWAGTGAYSSRYQTVTTGPLENDSFKDVRKMLGPNKYVTERWKSRLPKAEKYLLERMFKLEIELFSYPIFFEKKVVLQTLIYSLQPYLGELPNRKWLTTSIGSSISANRLFYTVTFLPFYALSRWKLWRYERTQDLFKDDLEKPNIKMVK